MIVAYIYFFSTVDRNRRTLLLLGWSQHLTRIMATPAIEGGVADNIPSGTPTTEGRRPAARAVIRRALSFTIS